MNKKYVVLSFITLIIVAALAFGGCKEKKEPDITQVPTATPVNGSGLEDSIFTEGDDDSSSESNDKKENKGESESTPTVKPDKTPGKNDKNENETSATPSKHPYATPEKDFKDDVGFTQPDPTEKPGPTASPDPGLKYIDYETYKAMKPSEQREYMESFNDMDAFFEWYNTAKDKYEKENPSIEIDGGVVDLDKLVNGTK